MQFRWSSYSYRLPKLYFCNYLVNFCRFDWHPFVCLQRNTAHFQVLPRIFSLPFVTTFDYWVKRIEFSLPASYEVQDFPPWVSFVFLHFLSATQPDLLKTKILSLLVLINFSFISSCDLRFPLRPSQAVRAYFSCYYTRKRRELCLNFKWFLPSGFLCHERIKSRSHQHTRKIVKNKVSRMLISCFLSKNKILHFEIIRKGRAGCKKLE